MILLLALHAAIALGVGVSGRRLGRAVFGLCAIPPLATLLWAATQTSAVLDGEVISQQFEWVPALGLEVSFRLNGIALLMVYLISGVGLAVFTYSRWYFSERPGLGRFAAILTLFAASMLGIVLAADLLVVFVCWELTSITSYLLIGFEDEKGAARAAALQALLITSLGGLAMLAGFVLIGQEAGTYSIEAITTSPPTGSTVGVAAGLILLGAFTKSAQVPFHSWLPGAMAAPTPVSAYLHSATMVKAGVFLIAVLAPALAPEVGYWRPLVVAVGCSTMLIGGYRALRQHDLKLLLAFGTVSQLGFMVVLVGMGLPALTFAGMAVILAHALFKSALFLVVGIVDHQTHTRDLRSLSGLGKRMPVVATIAIVSAASMAGIPPLLGFVAKESALEALIDEASLWALLAVAAGSAITVAYSARFAWGAFATKSDSAREAIGASAQRPAAWFVAPAASIAALTVVGGLLPWVPSPLVEAAASSVDPGATGSLSLWHGLTPALGLSALIIGAGAMLYAARGRVQHIQEALRRGPSAQGGYEWCLRALNVVADRTTGIVQNGSLPVYLGVILITVLVLPGSALIGSLELADDARPASGALQLAVGAMTVVTAVVAATVRERLHAVVAAGAVGLGVAVLFVIQGAPDLALTQLLIETLTLVIFVVVLRKLPREFKPVVWRAGRMGRIAIAAGVGAFVTTFALVAGAAREGPSVSAEYLARSLPEGQGSNVVNVILVDFRAMDTLGEITVLLVAALGVAGLAMAGRRSSAREESDVDA